MFYLDESGNAEGDAVSVFLEGTDRDGRDILTDGLGQGSPVLDKSTTDEVDHRFSRRTLSDGERSCPTLAANKGEWLGRRCFR